MEEINCVFPLLCICLTSIFFFSVRKPGSEFYFLVIQLKIKQFVGKCFILSEKEKEFWQEFVEGENRKVDCLCGQLSSKGEVTQYIYFTPSRFLFFFNQIGRRPRLIVLANEFKEVIILLMKIMAIFRVLGFM